ncbi:MAG: hypothetical protein IJR42_04465 [Paludibacteraceae bacterium]|nr:hypothetical protein [Paludibacteraceae bacterium]
MKIRASHRVWVLVLWLLGTGGGMSRSQNAFSPSHYIDIEVGGGVGGLGYELDGGRTFVAPSFSVGAGYTWFFLPIAGLQTGVRLTRIAITAMLTEPMEWRTAADGGRLRDYMGEEYTHRASFNDWKEREQMWLLQVPIGLRFRHFASTDARYGLHAAVGALLSVPLRSTYTLLSGEVTHTGWYEQWRLLLHDLPGRFETENYPRHEASFGSRIRPLGLSAYGEAGMVMRLGERAQLVVAAYVQWMPMDFASMKSGKHIPIGFATERNHYTFMSEYQGLVGTDKTSAVRPWSAGVKVAISLWPGQTTVQRRRCMCAMMK